MLRLYSRLILFPGRRHSSNFVKAAGFFENTSSQEYAKRPILIEDETKQLTYEALNNRIGQYAALLHGKYGINKGDRLLSRTTKTLDTAALYFATLRLGAIYIPLNPDYTSREATHFVNDGEPKMIVTCDPENDKAFQGKVSAVVDENALAKEANKQKPALEVENVEADDVAVILYTSGTTGLPKGAMLTHKNLQSNAEALADLWQFTKDDVMLHTLPFYHIHGMCISIGCTLMSKSAAIFRPKFSVEDTLKWMPKSTVFIGVPTYFSRLMAADEFKAPIFKNIRVFVSGSAPLTSALWESFRVHTGQPILERYGMTETLASTSNPYDHIGRRPGSVGLPVPGMDIRIGDKRVIEVKGPSVFKGYWKLPEKTKSEFTADGYFRTGDVGEIDDKGYIHIFARDKDVIISGGLNVYPKEVEDLIDTLKLVKEAAVIGVPHPDFGEAVVAVCIPKDGEFVDADLEEKLKNQLKEKLANYKRPKKVIFVDDYPRNFIGKIKKNELRAKYKALFQNIDAKNAQTN
ncbi:AMP-binding enzyme domain-containing protein [Ditylenchus destructor]|uniref:AMP-binding enzyme domain-containing protein n=1 Tax=Ditylenchus destructor TaxID=166010 RepID=A0AAD4N1J5_9BILA|nr:AMP-binding enzyme domain-containing protein [Ditylenchus destructor]